jgi:SsrA-binding protein
MAKNKSSEDDGLTVVATNRDARRSFELLDVFEAGIVLRGSEVKSLRESKVQLNDAYCRFDSGELYVQSLHISPYSKSTDAAFGHIADRPRKLLLHRGQLDRLKPRVDQDRLTLVPTRLYFKGGRAKLEFALARSKKLHDKRADIARRDADRDTARAISQSRRRS